MSARGRPTRRPWTWGWLKLSSAVLALAVLAGPGPACANEAGPPWAQLSAEQRQALAPLEADWPQIDAPRKQKWLEVASRFRSLSPDERTRIQARMAEWARMTPAERTRARLQFQEARQLSAEERQARWQAYRALPEDERKQLEQQARQPQPAARNPGADTPAARRGQPSAPGDAKRNVVAVKAVPPAKAVTPASVQARPGATTTSIAKRPAPPPHQQPGLPKIAATPTFVDPATLLPRRGPQGAAPVRVLAPAQPDDQP
jgi:hypothetical protein